ncbi:MAG: hypothetical protein LC797_01240 [Chloroflexi bacterium]|nr:hypothetical protein [Chloroflexota bacterium]
MERPARPDDGSPARLIAVMVGIVGILLLGSLAWSAVGALFSALGEVTTSLSTARATPEKLTALIGTPTPSMGAQPRPPVVAGASTPTLAATPAVVAQPAGAPTAGLTTTPSANPMAAPTAGLTGTLLANPSAGPTAGLTATPAANARAPWILLPQPAPDSQVSPGAMVIEARGRGDTSIATIRLELDGVPLPVSLEQRSESVWRGFANATVGAGHHAVRATVVDTEGRTGGFRWAFDAAP